MVKCYSSVSRIFEFSYPKTNALSAIPEGTIIGPVSEVHVVKIIDRHCTEIAFHLIENPEYTTCVVISREEERFCE